MGYDTPGPTHGTLLTAADFKKAVVGADRSQVYREGYVAALTDVRNSIKPLTVNHRAGCQCNACSIERSVANRLDAIDALQCGSRLPVVGLRCDMIAGHDGQHVNAAANRRW